ncbi:MAG TPA: carboxypeptidase regulatory-like domain-containing protein [Hymenobacter sp.]|uniref:TonB-dependent receptor n=1 Tax=Hymenobacter sp. TaxID=1898978 RepID=UPI002D807FB6|nr:carboxypeptidase regulatory-like domain-containing protein [Hymenobacter sp.]HET9503441.1 carboxypeptidase regulatory-like domain-containing protein [Hymenobacter sp.]
MKLLYLRHTFALVLLLLSASLSWGQGATTSAMSGTITDTQGQVLPGATVIAIHTPTNTQYVAPTNADGRFNIQNMRVGGPYSVRVTFVGFQDFTRTGVNLTLAENFRLDVKLGEGATQLTEVTVNGRQDPIMNADRTGAATTIQRQQIERLPTINRSLSEITRLTPQSSGNSFAGRNNLYNNITIDGAIFNNSFGLSGNSIGSQTNAQPISLDAIDQVQVSIAPFDVRQGSFTGAGINAVTRSGTNKFSGSVYGFYRNQKLVGKRVGNVEQGIPNFNLYNVGFRFGGPIVKDKLFFFVNAERERRNDPPTGNYAATQLNANGSAANAGLFTSAARAVDLGILSNFLSTNYGYNAGPYEGFVLASNSDKLTAKLDWNISQSHRFNIKYNYLRSYRDVPASSSGAIGAGRAQSQFGLPFLSSYYRINNNLNSFIAELNSTFGARFSNNLTAGYLANRDFRESPAGGIFPLVDIGNGTALSAANAGVTAAQNLTAFGYEPFSAFNLLNSDTYQLGDNFTAYLGKHNVTVGTYNELYKFTNGFAPQYYGAFVYNSLQDFYASAATTAAPYGYNYDASSANPQLTPRTQAEGLRAAQRYQLRYAATPDGSFPFAVTKAAQIGLYVQDEWSPRGNLKLTYGIRADLPIVFSSIEQNENLANLTGFRDGIRINTSQLPRKTPLFSPRIGFNWDVNDDKKTQVRGGTGIFTGRVPFVWISNQASNNGVQFGSIDVQGALASRYSFNPNVDQYRNQLIAAGANTSYNVAFASRDFKFPQVYRSNLAIDKQLFGGVVATLEGIYTKDLNAVYFQNVNLPYSTVNAQSSATDATSGDRRPVYWAANAAGLPTTTKNYRIYSGAGGATLANPNITDAILLNNTSKGYSYTVTGQLQKSFSNGLYAMAAYTYADSRSVNDGGTIAQSSWAGRQVSGDPNADVLSYSQFVVPSRVIASLAYRFEYLKHLATSVSMFYEGAAAGRFSYVYSGDMNGDNVNGNDLMYVPKSQDEIVLTSRTIAGTTYTAAQQWADLNNYIDQDPYLSKRRGQYAERNGALLPWQHRIDFRLLQDIFTNIGENRNTLQLSVDVFNIGNLLNKNWGTYQFQYNASPLAFQGNNAAGQPTFQYQYVTNPTATTAGQTLTNTYRPDVTTIASRWQMQLGVRYIFN